MTSTWANWASKVSQLSKVQSWSHTKTRCKHTYYKHSGGGLHLLLKVKTCAHFHTLASGPAEWQRAVAFRHERLSGQGVCLCLRVCAWNQTCCKSLFLWFVLVHFGLNILPQRTISARKSTKMTRGHLKVNFIYSGGRGWVQPWAKMNIPDRHTQN